MSSTRPSPGGQSSRGNPSMGDILRSMLVIAVILLGLYGIGRFFTTDADSPVKTVDYALVVDQARPVAEFPLLAPPSLPEGWRATSARFQPTSWHLGVLTDDEQYLGLEQLQVSVESAVERFAEGSKSSGTAQVAGQTWAVRTGPNDRLTYVRHEDGFTTLVNATTSKAVLESYVESLSTS